MGGGYLVTARPLVSQHKVLGLNLSFAGPCGAEYPLARRTEIATDRYDAKQEPVLATNLATLFVQLE